MDDEKKKKCEQNRELDNKKAQRRRWAKEEIPSAMTQVLILPRLLEGTSCKDTIRIEDVLQTIKEVWVEKNSVQSLEALAKGAASAVGAAGGARRLSVPEAVIRRHALRRQRSDSEEESAASATAPAHASPAAPDRFRWPLHSASPQAIQADKMCVGHLPTVVGRKDIHDPFVGFVSSVHEKNLRFVSETSPSCRQPSLKLREEEEERVQSDAERWSRDAERLPVKYDLGMTNPDVLCAQLNSDPRYKQFEQECLGIVSFLRKCMQTLGSERENERAALAEQSCPPVTSSSEKSCLDSEVESPRAKKILCAIPPSESKNTFPFVLSRSDVSSGNFGYSSISSIPWKESKGIDYEVIKSDHSSNSGCFVEGDRASESCSVTPVSVSSETSASWPSFEDSNLTPLELLESCDEDRDLNSGRTNVPSSQGSFSKDLLPLRRQKRTEHFSSSPETLVINDSSITFAKSNSEGEIVKKFVPLISPDKASNVNEPVHFLRSKNSSSGGNILTLRKEKRERNQCCTNYNSESKNQTSDLNISNCFSAEDDEIPGRRNNFNKGPNYAQCNVSIPPLIQRHQIAGEKDITRSDRSMFTPNTYRSLLPSCSSDTNFDFMSLEDTVSTHSKLSNKSALTNMQVPITSFMGSGTTYVELPYSSALSVPRYSAVPRSESMLVNVSSENSSSDYTSDSRSGSSSSFESEGVKYESKKHKKYCTAGMSASTECLMNDFQHYRNQHKEENLEEIQDSRKFRSKARSNILKVENASSADINNPATAYSEPGKLPVIGNRLQNISEQNVTSPLTNEGPNEFSISQIRDTLSINSKNIHVENTLSNNSETYTVPRSRKLANQEHLMTDERLNTIRNDLLTNNTTTHETGIQNRFSMAPSTAILMRNNETENFSQATGKAIDKYGSLVLPQISAGKRVPIRSLRSPVRTLYSNGNIIRIPEHAFMPNYPPDFRIKFKKAFEAIPEERSISLESSMEGIDNVNNAASNPTETKTHSSPIEEANEAEESELNTESHSKMPTSALEENQPNSGSEVTTNDKPLSDKQINTTPSLRGENSDSSSNEPATGAKLCVSVGTNTSEKDFMVSKGKAALAMENENDLVSQSKGWINFYMIKDGADATENKEESEGSKEPVTRTVTVMGGDKRLRRQSAREVSCQMCSENSSGRSSSAAVVPESRRISVAACEVPYEESWMVRSECCDFHLASVLHRPDAIPLHLIPLHTTRRHSLLFRGATPVLRVPALREKTFRGKDQEPQRSKQPRSGLPEIRPFGKQQRNAKHMKDSGLPSFGRNKDVDLKDVKCCGEFHTLTSSSRCVHGGGDGGHRCVVESSAGQIAHLTVTGCAIAAPPRRRGRSAAPFAPAPSIR